MGNEQKRKRRQEERLRAAREREEHLRKPIRADRIVNVYPSPEALIQIGPVIMAQWTLPKVLADALRASGMPVPPPVVGALLVDTGATKTCMSEGAAATLGLRPIRTTKTYGAGGLHDLNVYEALLVISIIDSLGNQSQIAIEQPVAGIPEMEKTFSEAGVNRNGQPLSLIGLLGRDFLHLCTLTYRGRTGRIEMVVDLDALEGLAPPTKT